MGSTRRWAAALGTVAVMVAAGAVAWRVVNADPYPVGSVHAALLTIEPHWCRRARVDLEGASWWQERVYRADLPPVTLAPDRPRPTRGGTTTTEVRVVPYDGSLEVTSEHTATFTAANGATVELRRLDEQGAYCSESF